MSAPRREQCRRCKGKGRRGKSETCPICKGSRYVLVRTDSKGRVVGVEPAPAKEAT